MPGDDNNLGRMQKFQTSFFEGFEVKVCILNSEAVINDQNRFLLFWDTLYIHVR